LLIFPRGHKKSRNPFWRITARSFYYERLTAIPQDSGRRCETIYYYSDLLIRHIITMLKVAACVKGREDRVREDRFGSIPRHCDNVVS
jgi:hypothetical protein